MAPPGNERLFEPNASIVLIGCRGAGKRTLGFMGALHLRRRLVTEDHYFEKVTGLSRGQYLTRHGKDRFARQIIDVFRRMLDANRTGCIIECGMSSFNQEAQEVLREYCKTHPVVYIHREREQIASLMDPADARQLLEADGAHRGCSNFEYYNLHDSAAPISASSSVSGTSTSTSTSTNGRQHSGSSKLLCVQEDFTRFLDAITGRGATKVWKESPFSVAAIPVEFRAYSYALRLRLSSLVSLNLDWDDFEASADCVELIIDHWPDDLMNAIARFVALIRRYMGVPIIYHVEENPRGERRRPPEEKNPMDAELLELGLRLGVDYISIDLQRDEALVRRVLQRRGRSKVIGNYWHMGLGAPPWRDDQHIENFRRAQALGCDVVRMVRFCVNDSPAECLDEFKKRVQEAIPDPKPPLVAYDYSVLGVRTPLQTNILAPVKHEGMENGRDHLATVSHAAHALEMNFRQFLLDPLKFYVLGSNVSYSLSPAMQAAAYKFNSMPHTFEAVSCATMDGLERICSADNFGGACLTAPFKVAVMPHLKIRSAHADAIGAVNVLLPLRGRSEAVLDHANARNRAGPAREFFGDNTDWRSILTCLRRAISPRNHVQPSRTTALVVGAGGMARAAVYALYQLGCRNIFIYNRTAGRAKEVAAHFNNRWATTTTTAAAAATAAAQNQAQAAGGGGIGIGNGGVANKGMMTAVMMNGAAAAAQPKEVCRVLTSLSDPWPEGFQLPTIVISCVPATSVDGNPPADFVMPLDWLRSPTGGVVVELAYEPLVTPLVEQMREVREKMCPSWVVVDGLEVVAEMAIEAFELMTGRLAPKRIMKEVCRKTWESQQQQQQGWSLS
ncbi:hypothetical protein VTH82DRAFT_4304 [Thermothelomyces myriococcoides]